MSGNASYRLANTAVLSVCAVEAPIVVTSAQLRRAAGDTYARVGMRPGCWRSWPAYASGAGGRRT